MSKVLLSFSLALATVVVPAISSTAQTLIHTGNAYLDHPLSSGAKTFSAFASVAKKPSALTILPTFDASITDDPNAADIEAAINAAITQLETHIVTPTTVKIMFVNVNNGLGGSAIFYNNVPYSQYRTDMKKVQALSDNDRKALKTLPAGVSNPVDGTPTVRLTLPLLRAVGEAALGDLGVDVDSTIFLNVPITNISRTGPQDPDKYDLEQVTLHEMCETIGAGGAGSGIGGDTVNSLDLYRYSANQVRSYTTDPSAVAYFSINGGAKNLSFFNQAGGGSDYADWSSDLNGFPQVQDAFSTPSVHLDVDVAEWTAIDIVGYNLNAATFISDELVTVSAMQLKASVQASLSQSLNAAKQSLANKKPGQADNSMDVFENRVDKFRSQKSLTAIQAKLLLSESGNIRSIISGL